MNEVLIEMATELTAAVIMTLFGVLGAWLTAKLTQNLKLKGITAAEKELIRAAQLTVGELQQQFVIDWKAAKADGKLDGEEIGQLRERLIALSLEKLSAPARALLEAAKVDLTAIIIGAGESRIERIKNG